MTIDTSNFEKQLDAIGNKFLSDGKDSNGSSKLAEQKANLMVSHIEKVYERELQESRMMTSKVRTFSELEQKYSSY